ncbi:MAG: tetratricopeptide repeat protein [Chloroflexi bacterium]|nr:tetratricopeptide repeat protein [Chloroflexota bacterium]
MAAGTHFRSRAYNNKAFVYRLYHQYSTAVEPFRQAIALYRQVDIRDEMADSINNLALVYANLGALDEAEALADDGRDLRERLAQRYPF